jgi:hypothetical protein
MPEPTEPQRKTLATLRETYGKDCVKGHVADAATGLMRVDLKSLAGMHQWYYKPDGTLATWHITLRLFTPESPVHKPRNAIDN